MSDQISQEDARRAIESLRHALSHVDSSAVMLSWFAPAYELLAKYPAAPALRACPHCGGVNIAVDEQNDEAGRAEPGWTAVCDVNRGGCGASGGFRRVKADAIRAWNRRP